MKQLFIAFLLSGLFSLGSHAAEFQLAPFKDKLFAYPSTIEASKDGAYRLVAFDKQRDVFGRDEIPLRKVHHKYINEGVRWSRRVRKYKSVNGTFKYFSVGKKKSARITVIWIHGLGGNHRQGVNDWTFGGNFNRLQNLMVKNKGLLLSPSFSNFKEKGARDILTLILETKKRSPTGTLFLACGSMGGGICWRLVKKPDIAAMLDGLFLLGSHWHDDFLKSSVAKKNGKPVPLFFGHGTKDVTFQPKVQKGFFNKIRKQNPNYPARFVMFDNGVHGTPIRMVDWRRELNWMLTLK
ncbi:MAG: alpha/beta hydrolase [Rhizobiaceae bacterium]